jgi:hypothetical protein
MQRHTVDISLTLLAQASMPLKFWDDSFTTALYLINRTPARSLVMRHPWNVFFGSNQTIYPFASLDAPAGPIFTRIIATNFSLDPNSVSFLGIVISTRDLSVLTYLKGESISLEMLYLMKVSFPF